MIFVIVTFLLVPYLFMAEVPIVTLNTLLNEGAYYFAQEGVDSYRTLVCDEERNHLIVGAKNHVFRLSKSLKKIEEREFVPNSIDIKACTNENHELPQCQIFINQLYIIGEDLLILGILAFAKPFYQRISLTKFSSDVVPQTLDDNHRFPSNPNGPIANIIVHGRLFEGSPLDKDSDDVAIVATNITDFTFESVRTKNDESWLVSPEFMGAFEEGDAVYFVFRELALEVPSAADDFLPPVLSRVGRVCKNDNGGKSGELKGYFVSFTKARLVCDDYDLVTAAAYNSKQRMLYASFTSSDFNSTAVCLFEFSSIEMAFNGKFHYRVNEDGEWEDLLATDPRTTNDVEETCFGQRAANEAIHYHLMTKPIKSHCNKSYYKTTEGNGEVFTAIAFSKMKDFEVYFADSKGRVWNFTISSCTAEPLEMWDIEGTPSTATVNSISVQESILVLTDARIISIPFQRTSTVNSARLLGSSAESSYKDTLIITEGNRNENPLEKSSKHDAKSRKEINHGSKASVITTSSVTIFYFIIYLCA